MQQGIRISLFLSILVGVGLFFVLPAQAAMDTGCFCYFEDGHCEQLESSSTGAPTCEDLCITNKGGESFKTMPLASQDMPAFVDECAQATTSADQAGNTASVTETADEVAASGNSYDLEVDIGQITEVSGLSEYINSMYEFLIGAVGIVATVMIMWGGMQWIFAAGDSGKIGKAKKTVLDALMGLVLTLCSFLILTVINPELVGIENVTVPTISFGSSTQILGVTQGSSDFLSKLDCGWYANSSPQASSVDYYQLGEENSEACGSAAPGEDFGCYCNLRNSIVNVAKAAVGHNVIHFESCWEWVEGVYWSAGAGWGGCPGGPGSMYYWEKDYAAVCKADGRPVAQCIPPNPPPYDALKPGDWVIVYNANPYEDGTHSIVFIEWVNQADRVALVGGGNGDTGNADLREVDLDATWPAVGMVSPDILGSFREPEDKYPGNLYCP